ncbi:glutamate/aspartate ABC transporter substrate-binding protein [Aquitalea sp. S1-19]|uniref:Glutamate/aspartate ABC transporter substrate-binding protein n=1 Tax=Craterilacuibacter sinensis TaxID=2686017 RepID=A0A845BIE8_9NEIS|nr:glutamate/aspartate ABC transporter substrate-binding protein [Craterilacuibacter sinensis]MCP9761156.1 glutamate/aspartate ABC transporter substrate-binding protein [Aquitalea sp. S1-19]MXR35932.1 glutamate/aspartate ABC transporter substrate-binding protein [Craterilacuibacter sinensis]RQW27079.1 glutamate/aspartate ABC transporter substrate-binding protein [Rhodobacteraceae bacterium CH30]
MPHTLRLLPLALACTLLSTSAMAAEPTGTLKKIRDSGTIVLGHRDSAIPFAYLAGGKQPVGYSLDLAQHVVDAVKKELNMPNLKVRYNMVTGQTRIPLLQNGTVDIECGATTNNVERQRQVDFSVGIFEIGTRLLVKKDSGIKDFADLKGKNVVVSAGTTGERLMRIMNANQKLGMNIVAAKDNGESFLMLESGRVAAFMTDDAMLYGERAKARNPAEWVVVGKPQSSEIYGCMMRKGDAPFKALVDKAIVNTYKSGQINAIYDKWFMRPIPPKNLNLGFPMSPEFKALIAKPSDKPAAS